MYKKIVLAVVILALLAGAGYYFRDYFVPFSETAVIAKDQNIQDNKALIKRVDALEDGWVVVYQSNYQGLAGEILGYAKIKKNRNRNIEIFLQKEIMTPYLAALLHVDRGQTGVFEYPGTDGPVIRNGEVIMKNIRIKNI